MDAQVRITGGDEAEELASLWEWLHDEEELRGDVSPVERELRETDLGGAVELLTVVLSSSGAGIALSRSLTTWLKTRRSNVKVSVSVSDRVVELEATNVKDALPVLREVLQTRDDESA